MNFFRIIFFLPLILFSTEEISVALKTKSGLATIRVKEIQNNETSHNLRHFKELKKVLEFDFNHNGYTCLSNDKFSNYEIKLLLEKNKVLCTLKDNKLNKNFRFEPIYLSGSVDLDRKKIHKLSDSILKKIFGVKGISSTKILYSVRKKIPKGPNDWSSEIWISDYDGQNAKQITSGGNYNVCPTFIPIRNIEGYQNFLYVSYRKGQPKIFRASFNSPSGKQLFSLPGNQLLPSISNDSQMVAFVCDADGRPDLFLQKYTPLGEPIGKPIQLFSSPRATQATSSFSPDGSKLAFLSDKDGSPRVYVIDIPYQRIQTRPKATLISKRNRQNSAPCWSYDGKKIAYSAQTNGVKQIWVYNIEKDEERQLTFSAENKENPRWAPNSLHLVYNTEDGIYSELYIINLNHPNPVQITFGSGQKRFPCWEPKLKK
ncbi:MAG: translocation protein TolB [Chlamydiae bacterium CG10_big_fil_rev_8_21_14_0_10_35_9]|nr:MAG: translocation protein TolB [Chlamydiae bacterium CG10_big_fil_rev_8_21_14_0_10_35_9]